MNEYFFNENFLCARHFLGDHDTSLYKQQKPCLMKFIGWWKFTF